MLTSDWGFTMSFQKMNDVPDGLWPGTSDYDSISEISEEIRHLKTDDNPSREEAAYNLERY